MRFEAGSATDKGMVREANQDRLLIHGDLLAVADGMGGHAGGELAAETAVEDLRRFPVMSQASDVVAGIHHANREVLEAAERTGMTNMGTTVVATLMRLDRRSVIVANVGDSRAYLMSDGELSQITSDHSLVEDLVRAGKITEEEAKDHPHRNVVTRVLGLGEDPEVDTFELAVRDGDLLLLASDGLFNEVDHHVIATILANAEDLNEAAERLVERANQNGGHDNITIVIARVLDDEPVASAPASAAAIASLHPAGEDDPTVTFAPVVDDDATEVIDPALARESVPDELLVDSDLGVNADGSPAIPTDSVLGTPVVEVETDAVAGLSAPDRGAVDPPTDEIPTITPRRASRMRVFVFLVCCLAILGLAIGGFVAYATNAWFVDTVANEVVIHQGRPGGLLFIEPQAVQSTGIDINDLNPASRGRVDDVPVFSSLDDAEQFVSNLELSTLRTADPSE